MNDMKRAIVERIAAYDTVVLARHFRPDGDAIGSTHGLARIIKLTWPEKKVLYCNSDMSDYVSFLGEEEWADDGALENALAIIIDTATSDRVSDKRVLKAKEIIKIDHHIAVESFGSIDWTEPERSSACEMVAALYHASSDILRIDSEAATAIYTGMVTDSGRFRYEGVNGETLRMAALMLDQGVDIQRVQAYLDLKDYNYYKFQADVFSRIEITPNGLAWLYVDNDMQKKWNLTKEEASESVGFMSQIKGSICWLAFIDNPDGTIRVRLRSRFMDVDRLANRYHGGGHSKASGATCYSKEEMEALINDADKLVGEFKAKGEWYL